MTKEEDLILENQQRIMMALSILLHEGKDEDAARMILDAADITQQARRLWGVSPT